LHWLTSRFIAPFAISKGGRSAEVALTSCDNNVFTVPTCLCLRRLRARARAVIPSAERIELLLRTRSVRRLVHRAENCVLHKVSRMFSTPWSDRSRRKQSDDNARANVIKRLEII
jgi:hypothetical protein